jgi:hypothetical protein
VWSAQASALRTSVPDFEVYSRGLGLLPASGAGDTTGGLPLPSMPGRVAGPGTENDPDTVIIGVRAMVVNVRCSSQTYLKGQAPA